MHSTSACWRLRQDDLKFEPSLDHIVRPCLRKAVGVGRREERRQKNLLNIFTQLTMLNMASAHKVGIRGASEIQKQINST